MRLFLSLGAGAGMLAFLFSSCGSLDSDACVEDACYDQCESSSNGDEVDCFELCSGATCDNFQPPPSHCGCP